MVRARAEDNSIVVKIVPCDSNGRTRPDDHPSPELVTLTSDEDKRAFSAVKDSMQVCWLRCHHREQQA